jgi:hypothetical protein
MGNGLVTRWSCRVLVIALCFGLVVPASVAGTRWVPDRDDTKGFLDIKAVAHGHGSGTRLRHTLTTFARWRSKDLWCGVITFEFPELDRELIVFHRKRLRAVMINEKTRASIGAPRVSRPTRRRVAVVFPRKWLRRGLDHYEWHARTERRSSSCPDRGGDDDQTFRDRTPRKGRRILHRL